MAQEICGKTKVTIGDESYVCENFPQIWELLENHNYSISEDSKGYLIRILFMCGEYKYDDKLSFEIVWED